MVSACVEYIDHDYYCTAWSVLYSLIWNEASGFRTNLPQKMKYNNAAPRGDQISQTNYTMFSRTNILYSANLAPPSWVHVFRAVTGTSVRTQAASIGTCFHIIVIWWLSGLPFDLWPHANDASNTNFISKMSWSPPRQLWWRSSRCMRWWNRLQYYKETPSQQGKCYRFYYFPTESSNIH